MSASPSNPFQEYTFKKTDFLNMVFLHPSLGKIRKSASKSKLFDRLEFLGDRVLSFVIADLLYAKFPEADEGDLSIRSANLVCHERLYEVALESGIKDQIQSDLAPHDVLGKSLSADTVEAFIAALYLDGGIESAQSFIKKYWLKFFTQDFVVKKPSKTYLQELAFKKGLSNPLYETLSRKGLDHAPVFEVSVSIPGSSFFSKAQENNIKKAENKAAEALIIILEKEKT